MPPQPGETTLLTLFADVHYFFAPESQRPHHHRFEKGSYVYIHRNTTDGRGRIEVANNAGTPNQDAFAGSLDLAHISYTYKKSTAFSIALPSAPQSQQKPWQIPAFDLRHERKYMYPIHSIDLYVWTPDDAVDLVEALSAIEAIGNLDVEGPPQDEQQPDHQDTLSPVVQQLEQAAIGSPYKRESTSTTQSSSYGPSTSADPASAGVGTKATTEAASVPPPLAYNPAAPAAPETRVHREKTPPPPDGHIPVAASVAGAHQQYAPQQPQQPGAYPYNQQAQLQQTYTYGGVPSPPQQQQQQYQQQYHPQTYSPTPPQQHSSPSPAQASGLPPPPGQQHAPSFPPPPPSQSGSSPPPAQSAQYAQHPTSPPPTGAAHMQHGYNPQQQQQQQQYAPTAPSAYAAGPQSPGFAAPPLASPGLPPPPQQQQQQQQQPNYSSYSYATNQAAPPAAHNIHQQFYTPTAAEAGRIPAHHMPGAQGLQAATLGGQPGQPQGQQAQPGKAGKVGRVEKGVNSFFAKLDKKF